MSLRESSEAISYLSRNEVAASLGHSAASFDEANAGFDAGATRVSISSAAYRNPEMVREAVQRFGADKVIVAIDADAADCDELPGSIPA